ncbi:MAG TPA: pilus assembly protein N-terminal domain-containing protein [Blastocatellia bacterium]|nr:pilus assembly protein N-terminal domain-containing protein [Blastocatellia bacterium]
MNNPFAFIRISHLPRSCSPALAALLLLVAALQVRAQERPTVAVSFQHDAGQPVRIDLLVGQSKVIEFDQEYQSASVSAADVVDTAPPINPRILVINGLKFGQVNIVVWSKAGEKETPKMVILDVYVQNNLTQIDNQIKIIYPKENIQLSQANDSVVISGSVTKPEIAERVKEILLAAGFKSVVNLIKPPVPETLQVELQIRVAEVNRAALREIGAAYGGFGTGVPSYINPGGPASLGGYTRDVQNLGGNGSPNAIQTIERLALSPGSAITLFFGGQNQYFIRALQERGVVRSLAEPTLTAMNGREASFISGGEIPYTFVSGAGGLSGVSVQFKPYGIQLKFKPTIVDENRIQLDLEPEVSTVDFGNAIRLNDTFVPALRTRRAKTTLELRDGQSFALAGLLDNSESVNLSKIPGIGDIPILGELFKSRRFQKNETELLFLCTVKMVEPLNPDQIPRLPGVNSRPLPSALPAVPPPGLIEGESGHAPPPRKTGELTPAPEARPAAPPARLDKSAKAEKP